MFVCVCVCVFVCLCVCVHMCVSSQVNFICTALKQNYSLKGINRLYIYDTPLTLEQIPLIKRWGIPSPGMVMSAMDAIIDKHSSNKESSKVVKKKVNLQGIKYCLG